MEKEENLRQGELYYDKDNQPCQIITIAKQKETKEKLVIYQILYGDFSIYACSFAQFFQLIQKEKREKKETNQEKNIDLEEKQIESYDNNYWLYQFLDARTNEEKLNILINMKNHINDNILTSIALSLDIVAEEGTLEDRYQSILSCIRTLIRYEGRRLR